MYNFESSTVQACAQLRNDYLKSLSAPKDGMWETFVDMGSFFEIKENEHVIGYLVLNHDKYVLQFYVLKNEGAVFSKAIETLEIEGSCVATSEPEFLCLALDHQKSLSVNAIMYHVPKMPAVPGHNFKGSMLFRPLIATDFEDAVAFALHTLGANELWLRGYYSDLIERGELFGLYHEENLIATGECRPSHLQNGVADLGVVVSSDYRKKGIATDILSELLEKCRENDLLPICSTEKDNIGAQKAILKAGFIPYHRIVEIKY